MEYKGKEAQKLLNDPLHLEHAAVKVANSLINMNKPKIKFDEAKVLLCEVDSSFLEDKQYSS